MFSAVSLKKAITLVAILVALVVFFNSGGVFSTDLSNGPTVTKAEIDAIEVVVPTTTEVTELLSTTIPPTTTIPITTTTESPLTTHSFDVVVVGESSGAICAAVSAAEGGASVALLSNVGYFGGQSSAAGVSTMDDAVTRELLRSSGCYAEFMRELREHYGTESVGNCYFDSGTSCPEPIVVRNIFEKWIVSSGVTVIDGLTIDAVMQEGNVVLGVMDTARNVQVLGHIVIDGTEFSNLYPLINGLSYSVGYEEQSCAQKTTWLAIQNFYPDGTPDKLVVPEDALEKLRTYYGDDVVDGWIASFKATISVDGLKKWPGWNARSQQMREISEQLKEEELDESVRQTLENLLKWSPDIENGYRALADSRDGMSELGMITRTGVNHNAVDSPTTPLGIDNPELRRVELQTALHRMYAYLWFERYFLGAQDPNMQNWGVANDLGYETGNRLFWDNPDIIPDEIEQYLPLIPYTREGRRIEGETLQTLTWETLIKRNADYFADSVMVGGYMADSHGCGGPNEKRSGYGAYDVPIGVFIPSGVDGFLPGLVRSAGVDRIAASSLRMQPTEMLGGEVVGVIATLSVELNVQPRDVPVDLVRQMLIDRGAVVDIP